MDFTTNRNFPLLPALHLPNDLKTLSPEQLTQLAAEIREEICKVYALRSVHLASNLGVVELCIALHRTFDFTQDRLIWDTGHQIYPHKILTGRYDRFDTIRTKGGLMGFPNPAESPFDLMMTGHAGCSIGTALGLGIGDDFIHGKDRRYSVAVIGDGAFSSGTVFEALNHAGSLKKNLTVILNDNKMSICPRVGGLANHFDTVRLHPVYSRFKQKLHTLVDRMPLISTPLDSLLRRFKNTLKTWLYGGTIFETLGFRYIGPIDGHNIPRLQRFLKMSRQLNEPVLLHIFTEKGRGYQPAVDNPTEYHAPKPQNKGKHSAEPEHQFTALKSTLLELNSDFKPPAVTSFTEHIRNAIGKLMAENDKVCVITAAMCQGNMLEPIQAAFSDRFFDVGICESHAAIFAAGLAKAGMIPIVDIYSTFLQRSYDQLFQEVSLQNLPVIFTLDRAGLTGPDGPTHHGVFDIAYLRPFPNFVVMAPTDAADAAEMLSLAADLKCPAAIRYPKADAPVRANHQPVQLGKSAVVKTGNDAMIAVCGAFLEDALEAAEDCAAKGYDVAVVNARFVKPLDTETLLEPLRRGKGVITIEEGMLAGGFGSAVIEAACDEGLDAGKIRRLGIPDCYVEHGGRSELLDALGLNAAGIKKHLENVLKQ
ncbi:MAG: 1-deoxy-D-xylulose-5-phosphate synthase [Planctomycetaceae bacterium]|jgi:1-deoxy-D-xylulose-5-phosphate synthase|nr:1-deoxy-D-xylulose-5-phosphate synthase [Planctomycetaceae bacterium]